MDNDRLIPDDDGNIQQSFHCVANLDASLPADYKSTMWDKRIYSSRGFDQREGNETWNQNDGLCSRKFWDLEPIAGYLLEVEGTGNLT